MGDKQRHCLEVFSVIFTVAICLGLMIGCGGGGDGDSDNGGEPAALDINGTWQVEEEIDGNCSSDYPYSRTLAYTVTQQGNSVTIYNNLEGKEFSGSLNGYTLTYSGSVPNGDGTLTFDFTGQCAQDGQSFSGNGQWVYSETGGYSCNGTNAITCVSASSDRIDASGDWDGTYDSLENYIAGSFSASIVDTDGVLSGTLDVPDISISDAELTGTVEGNVITFGDIDGLITFVGVISDTESDAVGSYIYDDDFDDGTWQASRP